MKCNDKMKDSGRHKKTHYPHYILAFVIGTWQLSWILQIIYVSNSPISTNLGLSECILTDIKLEILVRRWVKTLKWNLEPRNVHRSWGVNEKRKAREGHPCQWRSLWYHILWYHNDLFSVILLYHNKYLKITASDPIK